MRSKFLGAVFVILVILLVAPSVEADFAVGDWKFVKAIELPPETVADKPVELLVDSDVFVNANIGLSDMRIIDDLGTETPYLLEPLRGRVARSVYGVQVFDRGYVSSDYSHLTADIGDDTVSHNQLILTSPSISEFWRDVDIEASSDNQNWSSIGTTKIYRVVKSGSPIESLTLDYPVSTARYLRIKIADDGSGDLQMGGATGHYDSSVPPTIVQSQKIPISQFEDAVNKTSTIDFDRGRAGTVFHSVELESNSTNFNRDVTVQLSNDRERWRSAGRTEIYSYTVGINPVNRLRVSLPESTERYIRIVVFNQDNPAITISGAVFSGFEKRLVFLADPARAYSLYYGKNASSSPIYDIGQVLSGTSTDDLPRASAGSHLDNPDYVAPAPSPVPVEPFTERLPWLIPLIVGLAAAAIGFLLLSILRKARALAPPPNE